MVELEFSGSVDTLGLGATAPGRRPLGGTQNPAEFRAEAAGLVRADGTVPDRRVVKLARGCLRAGVMGEDRLEEPVGGAGVV